MKKREIYIGIAILVIGFGIMFSSRFIADPAAAGTWKDTDIQCLGQGHQSAQQHIHAQLSLSVDGTERTIPANVGVNSACMAEVHTHDASGELHIETTNANDTLTMRDFLSVWEQPLERDSYTLTALVDGEEVSMEELRRTAFEDGQEIALNYTSVATSTAATTSDTQ